MTDSINPGIAQARARAEELRALIRTGKVPYKEGRAELEQCFAVLNLYAKDIAKRHGMKYRPLNVGSFLR